mgnify:CR=1 FL=1
MAPELIDLAEGEEIFSFEEQGVYLLGRSPKCDIRLEDLRVSRRHCKFDYDGDNIYILDLHSTNGTQVAFKDGETRYRRDIDERTMLEPGAQIFVGPRQLEIRG